MVGLIGVACTTPGPAQDLVPVATAESRLKDYITTFKDVFQIVAIIVAAIWAYYRFGLFREGTPRGTITHRITHRPLTSSTIHVSVTVVFSNTGRVSWVVGPEEGPGGRTIIQMIKPITDEELALRENEVYSGQFPHFQWPVIDERDLDLRVSVGPEPDTAERHYEFIIDNDVETILVYSSYHFRTRTTSGRTGVWDANTIYDITQRSEREPRAP